MSISERAHSKRFLEGVGPGLKERETERPKGFLSVQGIRFEVCNCLASLQGVSSAYCGMLRTFIILLAFPVSMKGVSRLYFVSQLFMSVPVGIGQVYGCDNPWTGGMFIISLFISSPITCAHAVLGSAVGMVSGERSTLQSAVQCRNT